jgi:hypothetical protein
VTYRLRALIAAVAVLIGALVLSACGGGGKKSSSSSGGSGNDATSLIDQTFSGSHAVKSGKANVEIDVNLKGSGSPGPISIKLGGPFASQGSKQLPKFNFGLTASVQGQSFNAGLVTDGNSAAVNFQGTNYSIPANVFSQFKQGFDQAEAQAPKKGGGGPSLKDLGIDPLKLVSNPKIVGEETVGGADTTHISSQIDVDQLLNTIDTLLSKAGSLGVPTAGAGVPTHLTDSEKQQVKDAVKSATLDIWTGKDDHTFRKLQLRTSIAPPKGGSADVSLSIQLSDLNQPQTITVPKGGKSINDLLSQFGGLGGALGGLGGSSGGSGGSGSTGGGASTQKLQKYESCIQKAGSDLTKAQKCASLLTG